MKPSVVAAIGAALIATLGVDSAVRAATIDFGVVGIGGTIGNSGSNLEESTALDLDESTLFVSGIGPGDDSGLAAFDTVSVFAPAPPDTNIIFGSGTGTSPLVPEVVVSWTGSNGAFTETLTIVKEVARNPKSPDSIGLTLLGTVTGPPGSGFADSPVSLTLSATQDGGPGNTITVSFTNATGVAPSIPEPSTWVMMALGFGALGYAGFRRFRRKAFPAALGSWKRPPQGALAIRRGTARPPSLFERALQRRATLNRRGFLFVSPPSFSMRVRRRSWQISSQLQIKSKNFALRKELDPR